MSLEASEDIPLSETGPKADMEAAANPSISASNDEHTTADSIQGKHKEDKAVAAESEYITGLQLFLIMITIFVSTLLAALEIGIIATAIPGITNDFHRLDDVGWYGSATFLLVGASSPMWGKLYKYLPVKWVYMCSVLFYLVGSIVAAAAPNSVSVIVGRAIQGLGAAGTLGGSVLVISLVAEPEKRPVLIGSWMGVFMVSTILGPVIGGAFTSGVSWRWCFWINLPLGGPILVLCLLFFRVPRHVKPVPASWTEVILQLDLPGFCLLLGSLVCFALALQWGGQSKAWNAGVVIALLVLWIAFTILFFVVEGFQGSRAMVPLRLLRPRITWANALWCYISNSSFYQVMFYLPIYFQSIHGKSAVMSGVDTLPFLAFFSLGALMSGGIVGKTRHLMPYQLISALLMVAGMALFYTMGVNSPQARYLGPQVLYGFALGLGNQIPMTAVQGFSKPEDVASSTGIMLMCQSMSGTYFVIVAQALFANRMLQALEKSNSNIDTATALGTGASQIQYVFQGSELTAVTNAYMVGIKDVFAFGLFGAVAAVLLALVIPLKQLPDHETKKAEETIIYSVLVPETYAPVLLRRRAERLSKLSGNVYRSKIDIDQGKVSLKDSFKIAFSRPWMFLFRESIVFLLSLYMAIVYGILYVLFAAFPIVYQQERGWNHGVDGLAFLGIMVGMLLAVIYTLWDNKRYIKTQGKHNGFAPPEARLPPTMVASIATPIGLFWFAWTNDSSIHWMASIAAGVPLALEWYWFFSAL